MRGQIAIKRIVIKLPARLHQRGELSTGLHPLIGIGHIGHRGNDENRRGADGSLLRPNKKRNMILLPICVETDVPASIVMPEAHIQEGARTANIPIKGAQPGEGKIFITVPGLKEVIVPVKVL